MKLKPGTFRTARWCYDYELLSRDTSKDKLMLSTGMFPYLMHKGNILVTDKGLSLTNNLGIAKDSLTFDEIESIYLGYDELFLQALARILAPCGHHLE